MLNFPLTSVDEDFIFKDSFKASTCAKTKTYTEGLKARSSHCNTEPNSMEQELSRSHTGGPLWAKTCLAILAEVVKAPSVGELGTNARLLCSLM